MRVNGERVKQAREIRGLTQEDLAARVNSSQPHISLVEQNAESPSEGLLEAIALATGFPRAFFFRNKGPDFPLGSLLYRKSRQISAAGTAEIRQHARIALELVTYLGQNKHFKSIPVAIPRVNCDPFEAAQIVRSHMGVSPDGPILGLVRKLERAGVLVMYLALEFEGFDAFSAWTDERERRPVIFLKMRPEGDRMRRTLAHELAHLVLHQDFLGSPKELDVEADEFTGELLFPSEAMRAEIKLPLTLTRLAELKRRWGISMQAVAHYACERGLISARQKNYIRAKLAKRDWLRHEPVEIPIEFPRLLGQMLDSSFVSQKDAVRGLSKPLGLSQGLLESIIKSNRPSGSPMKMAPAGPKPTEEEPEENVLSFPFGSSDTMA